MRTYLIPLLFIALLGTGVALAQTEGEAATTAESETVTTADLGIQDPGLLPSSRLYFFKEFRRGVRRFFTFNPTARVELELRITNEKAAEAKKVEEVSPQNAEAVARAIQNYRGTQERLAARFEALRETSQNPNVDRLLEQFTEHAVKHEKLFDELAKKFEGRAEVEEAVERAKERLEEAVSKAAERDDPSKFAAKLEKALVAARGSELKHVRSVEILDRISEKAPTELKERIERLRQEFAERLKEDVEDLVEEDAERVREILATLPGEAARHAVIIDEIRARAEARVARALEDVGEVLKEALEEERDFAHKIQEQIRDAEERVAKLEARLNEVESPPAVVRNLLAAAREHLARARQAFDERKLGEAFGQARSAEVLARNGLRMLEEERPDLEDLGETLEDLEEKISKYEAFVKERGFKPESNPKAYELLKNARTHLGFARDAFAKSDLAGVKLHIGHIRGFLSDLIRIIEAEIRKTALPTEKPVPVEAIACPAVFLPACEKDKRSDECMRAAKELVAKYPRCGFEKLLEGVSEAPPPAPTEKPTLACTQEYNPVCGVDGKTYSNECFAKVGGVVVWYKGECRRLPPVDEPVKPPLEGGDSKEQPPLSVEPAPSTAEFKLEADDRGFYPDAAVKVRKGSKVKLTFVVRTDFVYFGGLDFRSRKFETPAVKPGGSTTVEFVADESFDFYSYWPASNALKATGKVILE